MVTIYNFAAAVVGLLTILYIWTFKWCQRRILAEANQLPCPFRVPVIGNAYAGIGGIDKISKYIDKLSTEFGGIFCFWVGPVPLFIISKPDDLKLILNSQKTIEKDDGYSFLKPFFGEGLLTAPYKIWKRNRSVLNPIFHRTNILQTLPSINKTSKRLTDKFAMFAGKTEIDVNEYCLLNFTESASRSLIGLKIDALDSELGIYITKFMKRVQRLFVYRFTKVWLIIDCIFNYLYKKEMEDLLSTFNQCLQLVLNEDSLGRSMLTRETNYSSSEDNQNLETPCDEADTINYRKVLTDLKERDLTFTEEDIMHEIITSLAAGTDTSGNTLSFCLLTLANKKHIQEKLYTEIVSTLGQSDRDVTVEDLQTMPYLDCVVKETLRRYRIVPYIARKVTEDIKLTTCTIPTGGRIIININGLHMDPSHYPDPETFDPDRFLPENKSKRHPYSFLPFSGGPRNCIGKKYAMLAIKVTLVNILRRFKLSTTTKLENIVYVIEMTMGSKKGYPIKFNFRG